MQTLKVFVSILDGSQQPNGWSSHTDIELHLSANDSDCDLVITLPLGPLSNPVVVAANSRDAASTADDDYVLGGYAGI